MPEVVLYTTKNGQIQLDVNLAEETVWLSLNQLVKLFGRNKSVVSRHINNVFKIKELDKKSTVAYFATVQKEGRRKVKRNVEYYNLDVIISVGYRVNSKEGVRFRKWASRILRDYLIQGYVINEKRLAERGQRELQRTVELLQKTLTHNNLVSDIGHEAIQLILSYAKTWNLLLAYDENRLNLPKKGHKKYAKFDYQAIKAAIQSLKTDLSARKEASELFGQERSASLKSILKNLEQTFDGKPLYKTTEEKAAHLIYFVIKDHPFTDGNKRIGSFLFLLYLRVHNMPIRLNENGLLALALLLAESNPAQKEMMIRLIVNILSD